MLECVSFESIKRWRRSSMIGRGTSFTDDDRTKVSCCRCQTCEKLRIKATRQKKNRKFQAFLRVHNKKKWDERTWWIFTHRNGLRSDWREKKKSCAWKVQISRWKYFLMEDYARLWKNISHTRHPSSQLTAVHSYMGKLMIKRNLSATC